jgi:hypothetical protein
VDRKLDLNNPEYEKAGDEGVDEFAHILCFGFTPILIYIFLLLQVGRCPLSSIPWRNRRHIINESDKQPTSVVAQLSEQQ